MPWPSGVANVFMEQRWSRAWSVASDSLRITGWQTKMAACVKKPRTIPLWSLHGLCSRVNPVADFTWQMGQHPGKSAAVGSCHPRHFSERAVGKPMIGRQCPSNVQDTCSPVVAYGGNRRLRCPNLVSLADQATLQYAGQHAALLADGFHCAGAATLQQAAGFAVKGNPENHLSADTQ